MRIYEIEVHGVVFSEPPIHKVGSTNTSTIVLTDENEQSAITRATKYCEDFGKAWLQRPSGAGSDILITPPKIHVKVKRSFESIFIADGVVLGDREPQRVIDRSTR